VFISTRLLSDRFSLAFEFFINVGHAFVEKRALRRALPSWRGTRRWPTCAERPARTRGRTGQHRWEARRRSGRRECRPRWEAAIDEKAKTEYLEAAFSDAVAIYLLSLAVDFDYSELREREYPLLAPQALAERLRLVAGLFPPNADYEFAIRYRRRA